MTYEFKCDTDDCTEHTEVTAASKTLALRQLVGTGWGGVIRQRCPWHENRRRRMYNVR